MPATVFVYIVNKLQRLSLGAGSALQHILMKGQRGNILNASAAELDSIFKRPRFTTTHQSLSLTGLYDEHVNVPHRVTMVK